MKTTIEISDALFSEARLLAATEGTTLRQLVEVGLRYALSHHKHQTEPFKLRDATFGGNGLVKELQGAPWERLRDLTYEGRGS
jgi:hypothetical protein